VVEAQAEATTNQYGSVGADHPPSIDAPGVTGSGHRRRGSNISGDTLVEPADGIVPFRNLLTRPVILSIANYGMLAILDISLGALQPLFFSTPIEYGGLNFSPARIGLVLGLFGLLNGVFQGFCFARIVGWAGLRRTFMCSMSAFIAIFALFPVINGLARIHGVGAIVWSVITIQLVFWVIMDMSYG
jgi:hypothetical protein